MRRVFFRLAIVLFAGLFSKGAGATPDFALLLKSRFNIAADPLLLCTLCHRDQNGGPDSVVQPFGRTLVEHGLTSFDSAGLDRILTEMEANGADSDGDLVGDIAELKAGTDPNVNDITGKAGERARHGCYCSTPSGGAPRSSVGGPGLTALLLGAWRVRRRLARRARCGNACKVTSSGSRCAPSSTTSRARARENGPTRGNRTDRVAREGAPFPK